MLYKSANMSACKTCVSAILKLLVPFYWIKASNLLCWTPQKKERKGKEGTEEHAKDTQGARLFQRYLELLHDGSTQHYANHCSRDVHSTWEKETLSRDPNTKENTSVPTN